MIHRKLKKSNSIKPTSKTVKNRGLLGVGNISIHQHIISDLIYGVRKTLAKNKLAKKYWVLSEISINSICDTSPNSGFSKNHNIDFIVFDIAKNGIVFMAEIENVGAPIPKTEKKITECLKHMPTIKECFIIRCNLQNETYFERCTLKNNKLDIAPCSSKSELLGVVLKKMFTSF